MGKASTIGLDIAKHVFQAQGAKGGRYRATRWEREGMPDAM